MQASARAVGGAGGDTSGAVPTIPGVNDADEFVHLCEMMMAAGLSAEFQSECSPMCAQAVQRIGDAARESPQRDRPDGLCRLRFTLAAALVLFTVVTVIEIGAC